MTPTAQIKAFYIRWKNERNFTSRFNQQVCDYIVEQSPRGTVNVEKLAYELKALPKRCKDRGLSAKWYLKQVVTLAEACIEGNHGKVEFDQAEFVVSLEFTECCGSYCSEAGCCGFG